MWLGDEAVEVRAGRPALLTLAAPGPEASGPRHWKTRTYRRSIFTTSGTPLAANAGASIRELTTRMGHSSTRAAMIYQHSTDERQREVARKLDDLARGALNDKQSGT